jgi:hypothetical protein
MLHGPAAKLQAVEDPALCMLQLFSSALDLLTSVLSAAGVTAAWQDWMPPVY